MTCTSIRHEIVMYTSYICTFIYCIAHLYVTLSYILESLWPSIKDVRTKSRKIDHLSPCPQNVRIGSTPPCPCGHTINFKNSKVFCTKKCGRPHLKNPLFPCPQNVRIGQPPLTDVFYGRPLI